MRYLCVWTKMGNGWYETLCGQYKKMHLPTNLYCPFCARVIISNGLGKQNRNEWNRKRRTNHEENN